MRLFFHLSNAGRLPLATLRNEESLAWPRATPRLMRAIPIDFCSPRDRAISKACPNSHIIYNRSHVAVGWGALQGFASRERVPFQNTERCCCSLLFESKFCPTECTPLLEKQVRPSFGTAHKISLRRKWPCPSRRPLRVQMQAQSRLALHQPCHLCPCTAEGTCHSVPSSWQCHPKAYTCGLVENTCLLHRQKTQWKVAAIRAARGWGGGGEGTHARPADKSSPAAREACMHCSCKATAFGY